MIYVNEVFQSISGEAGAMPVGTLSTFIRLQGCNCICRWCDTPETQKNKVDGVFKYTPEELAEYVNNCNPSHLILTGGEPLLQELELLKFMKFVDPGKIKLITIETNGTIFPAFEWNNYLCHFSVDIKPPSSDMCQIPDLLSWSIRTIDNNIDSRVTFAFKFVVKDEVDLNFAIQIINEMHDIYNLPAYYVFSLDYNMPPDQLHKIFQKINSRKYNLPVILSFQFHKFLNMK